MKSTRKEQVKKINEFFEVIMSDGAMVVEMNSLCDLLDSIIPVHIELGFEDMDAIDSLLAVYPYLYQRLSRYFAELVHLVRIKDIDGDKSGAKKARSYRDTMEQYLKVVMKQYDALSRRITVFQEKR